MISLETPFGQLPVLEVDGKFIPQLYAHCRMLATEFGESSSELQSFMTKFNFTLQDSRVRLPSMQHGWTQSLTSTRTSTGEILRSSGGEHSMRPREIW